LKSFRVCAFSLIFAVFFFPCCGIDEYIYIAPIPQSSVDTSALSVATIRNIPTSIFPASLLNPHFEILYRIYISDISENNPQPGGFSSINPVMATHYNAISNYINSENPFSSSLLQSLFLNRGFKYLCIQGGQLETVLTDSILGSSLIFDFSYANRPPKMTIMNGSVNLGTYTLVRSDLLTQPRPEDNHFFVNTDDLYNSDFANNDINADVEKNNKTGAGPDRYTYAALYILAAGMDPQSLSLVYSTPILIHAFPVPELN